MTTKVIPIKTILVTQDGESFGQYLGIDFRGPNFNLKDAGSVLQLELVDVGGGGDSQGDLGEIQSADGSGAFLDSGLYGFGGAFAIPAPSGAIYLDGSPLLGGYPIVGKIRSQYNLGALVPIYTALDSGGNTRSVIAYGNGDAWTFGNTSQSSTLTGSNTTVSASATLTESCNAWVVTATSATGSSMSFGATVPATGLIRLAYNGGVAFPVITVKDSVGVDRTMVQFGASDACTFGNLGLNANLIGANTTVSASNVGTLIYPAATSFLSVGTSPASTGPLRLSNNAFIQTRNQANNADVQLVGTDTANRATLGSATNFVRVTPTNGDGGLTVTGEFVHNTGSGQSHRFLAGGIACLNIVNSLISAGVPRVGLSTPYSSDGVSTQAMLNANQVAVAAVYSRTFIEVTGALTAQRTLTFPLPASNDFSYSKIINNSTSGANLQITNGGSQIVVLLPSQIAVLYFSPGGVLGGTLTP